MEQTKEQGSSMAASQGDQAAVKKIEKVNYSPAELAYRSDLIMKLNLARDMRDRPHPELDGMTYIEYYESNRKKDLSYLPPKTNKQDVRIVTGTTREKDTTILTALLNMNLQPDVTAFDTADLIVNGLGDNMSDMVKKSREIEDWLEKRSIIYREMVSQGDVFVEEIYREDFRNVPTSELTWDPDKDSISNFSIRERLQKVFEGCESRMVNGKKVYLGNIREPFIKNQPLVALLNIYPRTKAENIYGTWERWKYVPYNVDTITYFDDGTTYKDWNLVWLNDKDKVCEIKVFLPSINRFMIFLNGVMMLPINYPLTAIAPTGELPMSQGKNEPISDFSYSKSQPSKTKIDQEVLDEVIKLMIEKTRQSFKPPKGSRGKKVYSRNIFSAGQITYDMPEGELFDIIPGGPQGVTQPEFSFYQLIKGNIDEKTASPQFSGDPSQGDQTATETVELKNQQMMKLGLVLDGVVNLERSMTWHRIHNICVHWTKKIDGRYEDTANGINDQFKNFSMNTTVDNGAAGVKMFRFTTGMYPDIKDHEHEEDQLSKKHGKPVRIVYMNPEILRSMKYRWYIIINPTPKTNDKLSQVLFIQNLNEAIQLFGPDSLNLDYAKQRFAVLCNEDYNKLFKKMSVQDMLAAGGKTNPAVANALGQGSGQQNGQGGNRRIGPAKAAGNGAAPMRAAITG